MIYEVIQCMKMENPKKICPTTARISTSVEMPTNQNIFHREFTSS
jgi:hypothetical protein